MHISWIAKIYLFVCPEPYLNLQWRQGRGHDFSKTTLHFLKSLFAISAGVQGNEPIRFLGFGGQLFLDQRPHFLMFAFLDMALKFTILLCLGLLLRFCFTVKALTLRAKSKIVHAPAPGTLTNLLKSLWIYKFWTLTSKLVLLKYDFEHLNNLSTYGSGLFLLLWW